MAKIDTTDNDNEEQTLRARQCVARAAMAAMRTRLHCESLMTPRQIPNTREKSRAKPESVQMTLDSEVIALRSGPLGKGGFTELHAVSSVRGASRSQRHGACLWQISAVDCCRPMHLLCRRDSQGFEGKQCLV